MHNTPSAASLSRFGLGHVRKHTPFALTLSSLHLGHSAKSLPKKRCFFGERPFCKGLPYGVAKKAPRPGGDAFEQCRSHSTLCEEWKTKHPGRGARCLARMSRGAAPKTPGYDGALTWRGRISFPRSSFPGSSALRASTPGLKSDDPSGASPLRDRQAVAAGRGSVSKIAQRQRLSLLLLISSNASPLSPRLIALGGRGSGAGPTFPKMDVPRIPFRADSYVFLIVCV